MSKSDVGFRQPANTAVYICDKVKTGHPILYASRDEDGDWQFLCGGSHQEGGSDRGYLVCLEEAVSLDRSLGEVADMCPRHYAERPTVDAPWVVHDEMEDIVRENIAKYGWHAMKVSEDSESPGFVYTIGLFQTFRHPELICVGLPLDTAHAGLAACAEHIRMGGSFADGAEFCEAFEGVKCGFRTMLETHYREYLGYARWLYGGNHFQVLQLLWPDRAGRLPSDEGCAEAIVRLQTALWRE